jgi:predicted DNA-binding transcriptional regulator YafY
MRHDKAERLLRLALDLQGTTEGLTLEDIRTRYADPPLSRRTAERLRDAVERLIPQLEQANPGEVPKRWRIRGGGGLAPISAVELAALHTAATSLNKRNAGAPATALQDLHRKLTAMLKPETRRRLTPDAEFLAATAAFGMVPGPRANVPDALLNTLRHAMLADHRVTLHYRARTTGALSRQLVAPYGLLYGQRPYLVAYSFGVADYRLWSLANIERAEETGKPFLRDPAFDLTTYAANSFGVFQEEPVDVVWRFKKSAAAEARNILFHPSQTMEERKDGSVIVRFRAGGLREMCWYLFTWGDAVEILEPPELRDLMQQELAQAAQPFTKKRRAP